MPNYSFTFTTGVSSVTVQSLSPGCSKLNQTELCLALNLLESYSSLVKHPSLAYRLHGQFPDKLKLASCALGHEGQLLQTFTNQLVLPAPQVHNWMVFLQRRHTVCMPLLKASSTLRLERRCYSEEYKLLQLQQDLYMNLTKCPHLRLQQPVWQHFKPTTANFSAGCSWFSVIILGLHYSHRHPCQLQSFTYPQ